MMDKCQLGIQVMVLEYLYTDGTDIILLIFMRTPSVLFNKQTNKMSDSVKSSHVSPTHHFHLSLTTVHPGKYFQL